MSNFPSAPLPGAYVPPTEGNHAPQASAPAVNPQQQYYQQQAQGPAPSYGGAPQHSGPHKSQGIGQMFNQAVTTGKPMFNKFSKQISAKLSGRQPAQPTPQHLAGSYQNYQNHQQQQIPYQQPPQAQQSPQPPQQQWQTPAPQQQNTYPLSQQPSPFPPQSNYATPASANSGQSNYFPPQQTPQPPGSQAPPQQQPNSPSPHPNQLAQVQNIGIQQPGQPGSGQVPQGHWQQPGLVSQGQQPGQLNQGQQQVQPNQGQQHAPFSPVQHQVQPNQSHHPGQMQQTGPQQGQSSEQQTTGVINSSPSPHASTATPSFPAQPISQHQPQQQWVPQPSSTPSNVNLASPATPSPALQHVQPFVSAPPSQPYSAAPTLPVHPNQPQSEVQQPLRPPPVPKQQQQQQQQQQPQQWIPVSPTSLPGPGPAPDRIPPPPGPPPPETSVSQSPVPSSPIRMSGFPPPKFTAEPLRQIPSPHNEFVAELPGDLGNSQRPSPSPAASYQAYQPPATGRGASPGYVIPRRAVSMISMPLADPWSIADVATERPTREFYMMADLLFDALDKRFEPKNTGILEATKILESWRVEDLAEEAAQLFAYDSFSAFARIWSLEGVPHFMVPSQASLTPSWDFRAQSHSHEMVIPPLPVSETQAYPLYVPALNRAGWYKYLFLELIVEPEGLSKMMVAFCSDTYKPNLLNQPDLQKRDRTELTGLVDRASAIKNAAMTRVCQETAKAMQVARAAGEKDSKGLVGQEQEQEQEIALKMQQLKTQQQMSDMANQNTIVGGQSFSVAAGNDYIPRY